MRLPAMTKTLLWERCGFSDYRALEFYHEGLPAVDARLPPPGTILTRPYKQTDETE
jgi:hypothetical protein